MPTFNHWKPGEQIEFSAGDWNALCDMGKQFNPNTQVPGDTQSNANRSILKVRNDTNLDFDVGCPFRLQPAITPDDNLREFQFHTAFLGTDAAPTPRFVGVTLEPIKAGAWGNVVVDGWAVVKLIVNVETDFLCFAEGQSFSTGNGNNYILYKESGTGTKWGVVLLNAIHTLQGRLQGNLLSNNSATVHLYYSNNGSLTLGSIPLTVYSGPFLAATIPINTDITVTWHPYYNQWVAVPPSATPTTLRWYQGLLPGTLTATTPTIANCQLHAIDGGDSPASVVTCHNILTGGSTGVGGCAGVQGSIFFAYYNQYTSQYEIAWMPCAT